MKGIKSVLDAEKAVKAQTILHKPNTFKAIEIEWKRRLSEITGGMVVLKGKEVGQLSQFVKLCPAGTAEKVLAFALDHWIVFAKKVQSEAGLKSIPSTPAIWFLLTHAGAAINMWSVAQNTAQKVKMPSCATKPVLVSQPSETPAEKKILTLAEFLAEDEDE